VAMTCIFPAELDDIQLLTYLDGDADQSVVNHLAACPHCRGRAGRLGLLEARLTAAYYRSGCPSPMDLGEYRLGALARQQARRITRHVAACPHCGRELAHLERFLGDLAPAPTPDLLSGAAERIRVLVARLVSGTRDALSAPAPTLAPAYAGTRGESVSPAIFEAEGAQVLLTAQPAPAAANRFELLGLLIGADPTGFMANLWQAEALIAAVPVDEGGNLIFSDLAPGAYELVISGPEREIYIEELTI
jgi:hypothetical protein